MRYLVILIVMLSLSFDLAGAHANAMPSNAVDLISPSACPYAGCAAGQRINMRADFNLSVFDSGRNPDVQVCIYTPLNWSISTAPDFAAFGGITHNYPYNHFDTSNCETAPVGYNMIGGASAQLPSTAFGDSLEFAYRLGATATTSGSVMVRILEQDSTGTWQRTGQTFSAIPVTAAATTVYVANDAAACVTSTPCYVNSGADLTGNNGKNGIGTGLKDAVDVSATPITVNVLGNYLVADATVLVDKPSTLTGVNNASISYNGSDCSQPMLKLAAGATLFGLSINSGACATTKRTLVQVESSSPVTIDSNTLAGGLNAIQVTAGNTASVGIHFNDIENNSGYGILADANNTSSSILDAVANNILGNRTGAQAECNGASHGTVDHNFWGNAATSDAISQCTFTDAKRLGAPIQLRTNAPGVSAQQVIAASTLQYAFNDLIGFQLNESSIPTMNLYVINHGAHVPFTAANPQQPVACSNYWDVFRADDAASDPAAILDLHFKYTLSQSCISNINLAQYCGQTSDSSKYPLFWYESNLNAWVTAGQNPGGQPTTCDTTKNEITVKINSNTTANRPSFDDLVRLPFVVALPAQGIAPILTGFTGQPGNNQVTLNWTTSSPVNGFYVQRSVYQDHGFSRVSTFLSADTMTYIDNQGVVNFTTYYYKIEIVNTDLSTSLTSQTVSVIPIPPTATPTPTLTLTRTPTRTPTVTRTNTLFPTTIYYLPSYTRTPTKTLTPTSPFNSITPSPLPTLTPVPSQTLPILTAAYPLGFPTDTATINAETELANGRATRTAIARSSLTPTPRPSSSTPKLSLPAVLAILAGLAAAGGITFFLLRNKIKLPF